MILDEPTDPSNRSSISLSTFPPRPSSSHDSRLAYQPTEPLLPYAFRHGQPNPHSFDPQQSPTGSEAGGGGGIGSVTLAQILSSGKGRFRLLLMFASASLLFLLFAHFTHHGPPPGGPHERYPPFWARYPQQQQPNVDPNNVVLPVLGAGTLEGIGDGPPAVRLA